MKLLLDLPIGDGERCGDCPLADDPNQYRYCIGFGGVIRDNYNAEAKRCPACLVAEKELEEMIEKRAQEIVLLAFERSKEVTE